MDRVPFMSLQIVQLVFRLLAHEGEQTTALAVDLLRKVNCFLGDSRLIELLHRELREEQTHGNSKTHTSTKLYNRLTKSSILSDRGVGEFLLEEGDWLTDCAWRHASYKELYTANQRQTLPAEARNVLDPKCIAQTPTTAHDAIATFHGLVALHDSQQLGKAGSICGNRV